MAAPASTPSETEQLIGGGPWPSDFEKRDPAATPHGAVHPDMDPEAEAAVPAVEGEETPAAVPGKAPLFKGLTKSFNTPEELAEYTAELERKQIETEAKLSVYTERPAGEAAKPAAAKVTKKYAEKLFIDPDGTVQEIRKDILDEVNSANSQREKDATFWATFREENPDFVKIDGHIDIVNMVLAKNSAAWDKAKLSRDQIRIQLGKETRTYLKRLTNAAKPTETLPGGKSHALPVGGEAPRVVSTEEAPRGFAEQIKSLHKRKKQA